MSTVWSAVFEEGQLRSKQRRGLRAWRQDESGWKSLENQGLGGGVTADSKGLVKGELREERASLNGWGSWHERVHRDTGKTNVLGGGDW